MLAIVALSIALLLAELVGHSLIAGHAIAGRRVTLAATVAFVLRCLPAQVRIAARVFRRVVLLALPFVAAAALVSLTTLRGHDINYYLAEHPPEWQRALQLGALLGAGLAILVAWQLARWLYAVPLFVFGGIPASRVLTESAALTRGRLRSILPPVLLWWLGLALLALLIAWMMRQLSDASLDWAGMEFGRVLPLVATFMLASLAGGAIYLGLQLAGQAFLVTRLYAEQLDVARWRLPAALETPEPEARRFARPAVVALLASLPLAFGAAWWFASRLDAEPPIAITAHRGASAVAPENSMAAFRAAMEAGATYAELDVQHTRDGELAVLHDGDLMRMAGDPRRIGALTAAELAAIDIGRKRGAGFAGEHPPTLQQVIALVRGRMKLNVELKYNVRDPELAPDVVALLRRAGFLDDVVITSLDYGALKQVRALEPRLKIGHIVTVAVGNVARTEADFLSLNAARATPEVIRRAHAAGKDIHVWTVNQPEVMLRMIERGVDNIITDDPALLAQVMRRREALTRSELLGLRLRVLFDRPPTALTDPAAVPTL